MNKYLPTILAAIGALLPTFSADVQQAVVVFVTHNPVLSSWLVAVLWGIYHFMPSPIQSQITGSTPPKV